MSQPGIDSRTRYFRSLDELQKTPEFQQFLDREFPQAASEFPEGVSRRRWLQLMGASLALGGLSGCRYNREEVAAFVMRPEGRIPGIPEHYATNFEWAGRVVHALVANVDGRPLKVDGNAEHPAYAKFQPKETAGNKKLASAGTDVYTQGAILSLYDQDRIGVVLNRPETKSKPIVGNSDSDDDRKQTWDAFTGYVAKNAGQLGTGKGLAILIEPTRSPSFWTVLKEVLKKYPEATLVKYESVYTGNVGKALDAVGASNCSMVYDLDQAKVIVALDSDLLGSDPNAVQYSRQYANHRDPGGEWMNRLYCVESQYSVTGTAADFRLAMQASKIDALLNRIEKAIDAGTIIEDKKEATTYENLNADEKIARAIECIASDLLANKGSAVLAVGSHHSLAAQVAAIRINNKLGNIGKTVKIYENPLDINGVKSMKLDDFVVDALESKYDRLWVLAPNPVFSVAGDVDLAGAMTKIADVVYLSNYDDETAYYARWTVPGCHPLESWGDVRAMDGTYSICQPTIAPLLGGKTATELLVMLAGLSIDSLPADVVIADTAEKLFGTDTTVQRKPEQLTNIRKMREALHAGFLAGSESKLFQGTLKVDAKELQSGIEGFPGVTLQSRSYLLPDTELSLALDPANIEVLVLPSDTVYDGRLGNNGWLQECPHPVTKLTWDNAAICSPATAAALGLKQGELAVLTSGEGKVKLPVFIVPGHAEGSFTVNYGYGHSKDFGGTISGAVGTDLSSFRRWNQASLYTGVTVKSFGEPYRLATTQDHFALDDLGMSETAKRAPQLVREGTYFEYKENPAFTSQIVEHHFENKSLWKEPEVAQNHAWGMAIDLNKCTGCNSCVVACQAENNVPIVGKEQVIRGREMHWLRIDRYFQADVDPAKSQAGFKNPIDAKVVMQPMACAHCETAPCEQVCPVAATVHTEEGINAMAYNRCIGTRYCANNCPYKVRRFNYFNYNDEYGYFYGWQDKREQASKKLQSLVLNPEVSVRGRGVMEKCTYCVQRVQNGKIYSRSKGDGKVHDGDIRSACQDACPTGAIVFGDLNDHSSRVYGLHHDPRSYAVLEELNIKPRTLYLSRIRNVPKRLATASQLQPPRPGHGGHGDHEGHGEHGH
ncbi:MAG: TAT-variant-translocated molybdopterin oxidoreductase, partial [Planctomycetota bacterium]